MLADYRVTGLTADGRQRAVHQLSMRRVVIDVRPDPVAIVLAANALDKVPRGVARIVDHGRLPDGRAWCATEQPDGLSLADVLLRRTLTAAELATLLRDTASILATAPVHGGLRAEAIYFGTGAHHAPVIITDWLPAEAVELSVYAAPEFALRRDARTDIYALGVLAYRASTGRYPDLGVDTVLEVPEALGRLIVRMLALDPGRRPSAAEVAYLTSRLLETDTAPAPRPIRWTPPHGMSVVASREQRHRATR